MTIYKATPRNVTDARIAQIAQTKSAAEIADILDMEEDEVIAAIERSGRTLPRMIVTCEKTGRHWPARSERGAYRLAQIKGLVDWNFAPDNTGETA